MADSIQILGGPKASAPVLAERALGLCTDTGELLAGLPGGNRVIASADAAAGRFPALRLTAAGDPAKMEPGAVYESSQDGALWRRRLDGTPERLSPPAAAAVAPLETEGTAELMNKINELLAALRAAGLMAEE